METQTRAGRTPASRPFVAPEPGDSPRDVGALQERAPTPTSKRHVLDFAFLVLLLAVAAASCIAFVASREASGWKHETTPVAGLGSTSLSAACRGTHGGAALRFGGEGLKLRCGMHCADHGHQARRIDPTHQAQEEVRLHCLLLLSSASGF